MQLNLKPIIAAAAVVFAAQASAQVTFYEQEGFRGRAFSANKEVGNFERFGFNDKASSAIVERGRWEVCEDARFEGKCVVLRRGSYDSLRGMGLGNRISSVRQVAGRRAANVTEVAPVAPVTAYEWRQRPNERLYQAQVTNVRAVVGTPEQRCWVEKQAVPGARADLNVPGAVIGGVLGGILGHQIGGGSGRTAATIGGAVGGGALGANIDRIRGGTATRDVRRCETVASNAAPQYYDVDYSFRGTTHHAQTATAPGATITVNGNGEPRL